MRAKYIFIFFGLLQLSLADVLHILPYAQWTFDTPIERVIYRTNTNGFPIKYTLTPQEVTYYDSLGNTEVIKRTAGDVFKISRDESHFMLVQQNESIMADNPQTFYSFSVYDYKGNPEYIMIHGVQVGGGNLNFFLTDQGSIVLTQKGQPWVMEKHDDETLLLIPSAIPLDQKDCEVTLFIDQLIHRNEFITASTCDDLNLPNSRASLDLHIWNHNKLLAEPQNYPGKLVGLEAIPGTDYYFLEIFDGYESALTLFNRENMMRQYPWKTWDISPLGRNAVFVVSEKDFNVINLGDGEIISSYHPIDIASVSDAVYLHNWSLFLYIRYEAFFTEAGEQAFRSLELEGVSKTGQIAHRSSFGSWTTTLPKISQIGKDLFAIHMHNAVLLYRIELEKR